MASISDKDNGQPDERALRQQTDYNGCSSQVIGTYGWFITDSNRLNKKEGIGMKKGLCWKLVLGAAFCILFLGMQKQDTSADIIYFPRDEFVEEHERECEQQWNHYGGRRYKVKENAAVHESPEEEDTVGKLDKGDIIRIYYIYKDPNNNAVWGLEERRRWILMQHLEVIYDHTQFMSDHASELSAYHGELEGYELYTPLYLYEYPGHPGGDIAQEKGMYRDKPLTDWLTPQTIYTDPDGKVWGYVDTYNCGRIKGWYCISDLPVSGSQDYNENGFPKDWFADKHKEDCQEQWNQHSGRCYIVKEDTKAYLHPESENSVDMVAKGDCVKIYYLYEDKADGSLWGLKGKNCWVPMQSLELQYDHTEFMKDHASEIAVYQDELKEYELSTLPALYEYPGQLGDKINMDKEIFQDFTPQKVYTDPEGKVWGYVSADHNGTVGGWYSISDLPVKIVRDYDADGKIGLTDAQIVLRAALKINSVELPGGRVLTLEDAVRALKAALHISAF